MQLVAVKEHDKGFIIQGENKIKIIDVFKDKFGNHIHFVEGKMNNYEPVSSFVDPNIRIGLERNHSGTHLLFCALRNVLGSHIEQLGSDNNEERLTFDFPADEKPKWWANKSNRRFSKKLHYKIYWPWIYHNHSW